MITQNVFNAEINRSGGSNQGPSDLQADALPTELSRLNVGQKCEVDEIAGGAVFAQHT